MLNTPTPRDDRLAGLSASEVLALVEIEEREPRHSIPTTRLQQDLSEVSENRRQYLEDRVRTLLSDRESFGALLYEITGGAAATMAVVALRDAVLEQGRCWDGISAFGDLMHNAARAQAAQEWPTVLLMMAPTCSECHHSKFHSDPLGTGDSPSEYDCRACECPWGRK